MVWRQAVKKALPILAIALLALAPVSASAQMRRGNGGIVVQGAFIGGWFSPVWGPYAGPYWGPGWGPGYDRYPNTGEVKLDTKVKDALVFVNGSYAGTVHHNKTLHLKPGTYTIEIREPGRVPYTKRIYVALDKTLHLHPDL
jgi:PEGA domain